MLEKVGVWWRWQPQEERKNVVEVSQAVWNDSDQNICPLTHQLQGVDVMPCESALQRATHSHKPACDRVWTQVCLYHRQKSITPPLVHVLLDAKAAPDTNCTSLLMRRLIPTQRISTQTNEQSKILYGNRNAFNHLNDNYIEAAGKQGSL